MATERIKVAIRIRPFLSNEDSSNGTIKLIPEDEYAIVLYKEPKIFQGTFNHIFSTTSTQKDVFNFIKPCLLSIQKGINCTILAYGQTGTGKTYTMFGADWSFNEENYIYDIEDDIDNELKNKYDKDNDVLLKNNIVIDKSSEYNGIIPNLILELYNIYGNKTNEENINNIMITCSYIQIYNEKIYDLLDLSSEEDEVPNSNNKIKKGQTIKIKTDKSNGLIIDGANEIRAPTYQDMFDILETGENNRKIRQTSKNNMSSRSHTIFMINVIDTKSNYKSKIKLCDLAGSERYNNSEIYRKEHINEMKNINKSLFTLGNVINALASNKKYVPYKDSKLTRILEDSLKGNSSIYLIATVSPNDKNVDETFHTLKFADRAHNIMIKVNPNQISLQGINNNNYNDIYDFSFRKNREIEELKGEVSGLRNLISIRDNNNNLQKKFISLKKENNKLKKILEKLNGINGFTNIIKENKKLKKELKDLTIDYLQLKKKLILTSKENDFNILPSIKEYKLLKNSFSQGNILINKINRKKIQIKKLEIINKKIGKNKISNIPTDYANKLDREELMKEYKFPKIINKKLIIKNVKSKIDIIDPNFFINKEKLKIRDELKNNENILSSLKKLQMLNYYG